MLDARDTDVARLQREIEDVGKVNVYLVTELNKARAQLRLAGRTRRGEFARRAG